MNNQGLDALAALAAAASNSSYPSVSNAKYNQTGGPKEEAKSDKSTKSTDAATHAHSQPAHPSASEIAAQQWQQAIANAASSISVLSGPGAQNNLALLSMQQLNQATSTNPNILAIQQQLAMQQQLNYYQLLAHTASQQQRQFGAANVPGTAASAAQALSQVLGVHAQTPFSNVNGSTPVASSTVAGFSSPSLATTNAVPLLNVLPQSTTPPQVPVNAIGFPASITQPTIATSLATIAPQPVLPRSSGTDWSDDDNADDSEYYTGDKRQLKRVANRKSAQLSRKRKKQFIEELKEENDGLRRKEQILRSIPDLVVVFDSSGKLWFVSESVSRFLDFNAAELEGTSFWNRLCDDSVRLLKAAFMDSLAARQPDAETASLGSGTWELRLVDKDGSRKVVTLHGVVHFAGDRPECVCSIRPSDETSGSKRAENGIRHETFVSASTSSTGSCTGSLKRHRKSSTHVKPNQSVVSSSEITNERQLHSDGQSSSTLRGSANGAVRISDSGNSSGSSDSGSGDELNRNEIAA